MDDREARLSLVGELALSVGRLALALRVEDDLEEFVREAKRSEALAPLLWPSEWIRGGEAVRIGKDAVQALLDYRRALERPKERAGAVAASRPPLGHPDGGTRGD